MTQLARAVLSYVFCYIRSRHDLGLEILALRQQLAVFQRSVTLMGSPGLTVLGSAVRRFPFQSRFDGIKQFILAEWFDQVGNRPIGGRFRPRTVIGSMCRNENDRHPIIAGRLRAS
jgi:hypothetical protein